MALPRDATGLSAGFDGGISRSYPLTILDQWSRKSCPLKDIYIFNCCGHFVQPIGIFRAILVEGIMGNILLKIFKFRPVVQVMPFIDFS